MKILLQCLITFYTILIPAIEVGLLDRNILNYESTICICAPLVILFIFYERNAK